MFNKSINTLSRRFSSKLSMKKPVRVAVTGAAGQIGQSLLFRIASGQMLGPDQPVILKLIDLPFAEQVMQGVALELKDCEFNTLAEVESTSKLSEGFKDVDYCLLVGAKPRGPGMERADLLKDNAKIFVDTGNAINDNASRNCKTVVVGNPANTNALVCSHQAKDIPSQNFTAMTRLDHNRALSQLRSKLDKPTAEFSKLCIWGNHSPTLYADLTNAKVDGKNVNDFLDRNYIKNEFLPRVQKRGAEIIDLRKLSSAASAANAAIEHIRDWVLGTEGEWTSMGVQSKNNSYGIPEDLIFSFPVTCSNGSYEIVDGLEIDEFSNAQIKKTTAELSEERKAVEHLLK